MRASVGVWRSLVAHCHGVSGVGGSNPLTPTNYLPEITQIFLLLTCFGTLF